jgi:hypothetical protein
MQVLYGKLLEAKEICRDSVDVLVHCQSFIDKEEGPESGHLKNTALENPSMSCWEDSGFSDTILPLIHALNVHMILDQRSLKQLLELSRSISTVFALIAWVHLPNQARRRMRLIGGMILWKAGMKVALFVTASLCGISRSWAVRSKWTLTRSVRRSARGLLMGLYIVLS